MALFWNHGQFIVNVYKDSHAVLITSALDIIYRNYGCAFNTYYCLRRTMLLTQPPIVSSIQPIVLIVQFLIM